MSRSSKIDTDRLKGSGKVDPLGKAEHLDRGYIYILHSIPTYISREGGIIIADRCAAVGVWSRGNGDDAQLGLQSTPARDATTGRQNLDRMPVAIVEWRQVLKLHSQFGEVNWWRKLDLYRYR